PARPPRPSTPFPYTTLSDLEFVHRDRAAPRPRVSGRYHDHERLLVERPQFYPRSLERQRDDRRIEQAAAQHLVEDRRHVLLDIRSEEHTSELQSRENLVCRL